MAETSERRPDDGEGDGGRESRSPGAWADLLRRVSLLGGLSGHKLEELAGSLRLEKHDQGDTIVRQGEQGGRLHIIVSGEVEVRVREGTGSHDLARRSGAVARLADGQCFGEMSLLTGDAASADVIAPEAVQTLSLSREDFDRLVGGDAQLLRKMARVVSRRLADADRHAARARHERHALTGLLRDEHAQRYDSLVGHRRSLAQLKGQIAAQAKSDTALLVVGERGTGKEVVARRIHELGPRAAGTLCRADCRKIVETPWGDRLFGAYGDRRGGGAPAEVPYMDLARSGTLVLKHVERLPGPIQDRLAHYLRRAEEQEAGQTAVRIIATSQRPLDAVLAHLRPELRAFLEANIIDLKPLRERKVDIPELAAHFLAKHSARLQKPVRSLDEEALRKLVTHDYHGANVTELEEVIERAVMLAEGDAVRAEHVFLTPHAVAPTKGLDIHLSKRTLRGALAARSAARVLAGAGLLAVLVASFAPGAFDGASELVAGFVWPVGWPLLILSFVLGARLWCSVCPIGATGALAQRLFGREKNLPPWVAKWSPVLVMGGIVAIFWTESVLHMRDSAFLTGCLLVALLVGTVAVSIAYKRTAWCRYVCPLGGIAGTCATAGVLELRPTPDICATRCKGHKCYTGTEQTQGCPMYNHVMFMDTSRDCTLCLRCVEACPNGSPHLTLRAPGRELWSSDAAASPLAGQLAALLLGTAFGLTALEWAARSTSRLATLIAEHHAISATLILGVAAAAPPLLLSRLAARAPGEEVHLLWRRATAWLPIAVGGLLSYHLAFVPGAESLLLRLELGGGALGTVTLMSLFRGAFMVGAVVIAARVLRRASEDAEKLGRPGRRWPSLVAMTSTSLALLLAS